MTRERLIIPFLLILVWQGVCWLEWVPRYKLPSPWDILLGLKNLALVGLPPGRVLHNHLVYSLLRVFAGFGVAVLAAVPLGLMMGWSARLNRMINPVVEIVRPVPPLAWIPIAILWFGLGIKSAAFIIFLGAFFPILLNTIAGVRAINPVLIEAARTLNFSERDIFFKVLIPGAVPSIFVGMRIGLGIGWMTLVAAEFTGVRSGYGLGYMIMTARDIQRPAEIIAGMIVIGLTGLLIDAVLNRAEARVTHWR